jgi:hypothetical protein
MDPAPRVLGFNYGSPVGTEVWGYGWDPAGDTQIKARQVALSAAGPEFGPERLLLSIDPGATDRRL